MTEPKNKRKRYNDELDIPQRSLVTGMLLVCGQGECGQLGLGDTYERKKPTLLKEFTNIVDICAGGMHSMFLTEDGDLFSFGCNDEGALGHLTTEDNSELIPKKIILPGKSVRMSAGDSHSACLLEDGRVFVWGSFRNSHGAMGLTLNGKQPLPIEILPETKCCDIASGSDHLVILTCNGKVYTIGSGEQGQLGRVSLRSASGDSRKGSSELLQPTEVIFKKVKFCNAIWATSYCTFMKNIDDAQIYGFGLNNCFQLNVERNNPRRDLVTTPQLTKYTKVRKIVGGEHHTLLLNTDNKIFSIGRYHYGRLGLGNGLKEDVSELTQIHKFDKIKIIEAACGQSTSFAIADNGSVFAWGMGTNFELGTGNENDEVEPTQVICKFLQNKYVLKVSSGGHHTMFLVADTNNNSENNIGTVLKETNIKNKVIEDSTIINPLSLNKGRKRKA